MKQRSAIKLARKQRGVAMLEMAISLPLLILLLAVMGEIGNVMYQQSSLNKSIETGAIYASKTTRLGTGLVKINAQTLKNTQNLVLYGNISGTGKKIIDNLAAED
ncbi:MAG: TadE/TadG family type IV pilus assembly protein, partial [Gammaproteobacteria bacterium]|nr:TadE/TadG family type IV pilus assembly protein [Gammaproteobacteria bacterium]